jgi:Ca2+-binding EF-hand superfamily protein
LKISKAEAKEHLEEADTNGDGKMSFEGKFWNSKV